MLHSGANDGHPGGARGSGGDGRLQSAEDAQRDQPRHVDRDRARHRGPRQGRVGPRHRLPRRGPGGVCLRRGHLRVQGAPQRHGNRAPLQRPDVRGLHGDPGMPQADRRDDLRLLHGRRHGGRHGVRSALRRGGLEVRHPRGAAQHHLRRRRRRPARGPGGPRLREGHPLLRADGGRPRGARDGSGPAAPASGRARADHLRLSAARRRQRAPLRARRQADDRVVSPRIDGGAPREAERPGTRGLRERGLQGGHAGVPREADAQVPGALAPRVRLAFLTSTPLSPTEGSGTFVALDGLVRGLERLGHVARVRPLRVRTNFHTLDRWLYNVGALLSPPAGDVVVGVDLDGFLLARRRRRPFVAMLKGIIADELRNERGTVRALLTVQARWERVNAGRADRVVVSSRYSASVAGEAYGIPPEKLAVVPEPIDLGEWRRRFARAERRPATRPTVLSVARAAGLHVVACRAAAVPEVVEEGRTGLLVNPESPDALATAMETLLMNEALRKEFGAAGTRRVEAFDLERVAQRFLEVLP